MFPLRFLVLLTGAEILERFNACAFERYDGLLHIISAFPDFWIRCAILEVGVGFEVGF